MEYTINKLAQLAGVTARTLRYYDEIGLLKPARINSSGYRIYGEKEVDRLQQILLFRTLDMNLSDIQLILDNPHNNPLTLLKNHQAALMERRQQLDQLLNLIDKTIATKERGEKMTDQEKFVALKQQMIDENEEKYGAEIREKYDNDILKKSHQKVKSWQKKDWNMQEERQQKINQLLADADAWTIPSKEAQELFETHRDWLLTYWGTEYNPVAHKNMAEMYVADPRFTEFYEKAAGQGAANLLKSVIDYYAQ